jgi:hypothetical protein
MDCWFPGVADADADAEQATYCKYVGMKCLKGNSGWFKGMLEGISFVLEVLRGAFPGTARNQMEHSR